MESINTIGNVEDRYIKFRNALTESAQEVLHAVDRTAKQKWMTAPILQKINQRRLAKGDDDIYNLLHKEIKQACIEAWLNEQCQLIEQLDAAHKTNLMHCQIKEVTGKKRGNGTTTCVEAKDGTIIMEKDKILGLNTLANYTMTTGVKYQSLPQDQYRQSPIKKLSTP